LTHLLKSLKLFLLMNMKHPAHPLLNYQSLVEKTVDTGMLRFIQSVELKPFPYHKH